MSVEHDGECKMPWVSRVSRRDFIKTVSIGLVGASIHWPRSSWARRSGNVVPGRIGIIEDLAASSGGTVNLAAVKQMVDDGLVGLTGQPNPVSALEALLPDLNASKKITIKVNILEELVPTRLEMVKGLTDSLVQMLGLFPF